MSSNRTAGILIASCAGCLCLTVLLGFLGLSLFLVGESESSHAEIRMPKSAANPFADGPTTAGGSTSAGTASSSPVPTVGEIGGGADRPDRAPDSNPRMPNPWSVSATALATPPYEVSLGKALGRGQADPDREAVVMAGPVKVYVPAGVVRASTPVTVHEVAPLPHAPAPKENETLGQWDVSIGKLTILPKPVAIQVGVEIPARIAQTPLAAKDASRVGARYFDPVYKTWVKLPCHFDPASSTATIVTRHLCVIAVDWNLVAFDVAETEHYRLRFHDSMVRGDSETNEEAFRKRLVGDAPETDLQASIRTMAKLKVPTFIAYTGLCVEKAHGVYEKAGFDMGYIPLGGLPADEPGEMWHALKTAMREDKPLSMRRDIYFRPLLRYNMHEKLTGQIWLSLDSTYSPRAVRHNSAHELMHAAQANMMHTTMAAQQYRKAWMEALAEYGGRFVWGDQASPKTPYLKQDFLRKPMTLVDDEHEYQMHTFVRYLVEDRKLCTFPELSKGTLQVGADRVMADSLLAAGYAADRAGTLVTWKSETGFQSMLDDMAILKPLRDYCAGRGANLSHLYRDYAAYMLFDRRCAYLLPSDPAKANRELRGMLAYAHKPVLLRPGAREAAVALTAPAKGTADYAVLGVTFTPEEIKADSRKTIEVLVSGKVHTGLDGTTDLYCLPDGERGAEIQPLTSKTPAKRRVTLGPKDLLVAMITNVNANQERKARFVIRPAATVTIKPSSVPEAAVGETVAFTAEIEGLPSSLDAVKVEWRFEGHDELDATQTHPVGAEGAVRCELERVFPEEADYTLEVTLRATGTGEELAAKACAIHVGTPVPTIAFAADELFVIWGGDDFVTATTAHADPETVYRYRWTFRGETRVDNSPVFKVRCMETGRFPLRVDLLTAEGKHLATAETVLVPEKNDTEWVTIMDTWDDGEGPAREYLREKFQVRKGTKIRHGLGYVAFQDAKYLGRQWQYCITYEEDRRTSVREYRPDGTLVFFWRKDAKGELHGLEIESPIPKWEKLTFWNHGVKQREEKWQRTENGKVRVAVQLFDKDGKRTLTKTYYASNGRPKEVMPYRDGKPHGTHSTYHDNGQLEGTGRYEAGEKVGEFREWFRSGEPLAIRIYDGKGTQRKYTAYGAGGVVRSETEWDANGTRRKYTRYNGKGELLYQAAYDAKGKVVSERRGNR